MFHDILKGLGMGIAASQVATAARAMVRRVVARLALLIVAIATLLIGIGYLFDTAYAYAVQTLGPVAGGLTVAGGLMGMAAILFAVAGRRRRRLVQTAHTAGAPSVAANEAVAVGAALLMVLAALRRRASTTARA